MPLSRRALVSRSAWALPVVTLAVAAPAASASGAPVVDLGAFRLAGQCPIPSIRTAGFVLTAGDVPLPAGTSVALSSTGSSRRLVSWSPSPAEAVQLVAAGVTSAWELTVDLGPGASITFRATGSIQNPFEFTGTVDPAGDAIGTGSRSTATITTDFIGGCTAT